MIKKDDSAQQSSDSQESNKEPLIRDSFSSDPSVSDRVGYSQPESNAEAKPYDDDNRYAYKTAQMPIGVYAIGLLSLVGSFFNVLYAMDWINFVVAICNFIVAIGLILQFNFARKVSIVFAVFIVLISIIVLVQINHAKSVVADETTQIEEIITDNSSTNGLIDSQQQVLKSANLRKFNKETKDLNTLQTISIVQIIVYSIIAMYLLSPRVKAAFES